MRTISRYLAPFTLAEWGAILLYFYFSGRIAAFLHPNFRILVLVTGILLALTAAVLVIWGNEASCAHEHDEHVHGECNHDHHEHEHEHGRLTFGGAFAFLVLLLPVALAVRVSPDSYSETLVRNRGTIENVAALPGVAQKMEKRLQGTMPGAVVPDSAQPVKPDGYSITIQEMPEPPVPSSSIQDITVAGRMEPPPDAGRVDAEPPLPTKETAPVQAAAPPPGQAGAKNQDYVNDALKPNKDGNIKAEVLDLMYAAEDSSMRRDFDGKRVEMIGQFLPMKGEHAKQGKFKLLRMVMICCAADVQPVSVEIGGKEKPGDFESMSWVKVVGTVRFESIGDRWSPLVAARSVTKIERPAEQYLY